MDDDFPPARRAWLSPRERSLLIAGMLAAALTAAALVALVL